MGRRALFILIGCVIFLPGFSQDTHFSIRNYTAIEGLPQSQVTSLVEDSNGYIWLGTQGGGIARFDGREFIVYTTLDGLLNNFILDLLIDAQDNLWILHHKGITKYDGNVFSQYPYCGEKEEMDFLRRILEHKDTIYTISNKGLYCRVDLDSIRIVEDPFFQERRIYMFHKIPSFDELIFYTENGEFVTSRKELITLTDNQESEKFFNFFKYRNELWVKSYEGHSYRINFQNGTLEETPLKTSPYVLLYDEKRDIFWTRDQHHLYRETVVNDEVKRDTVLQDVSVKKVLIDSEGNTWFGTDGQGLYKYYYQDFDRCTSDHLRGVMSIYVDQTGASWIGTMSQGLWKIKKGKISSYLQEQKQGKRNGVTSIVETSDGAIWIGSGFGLGKYDKVNDSFEWYTEDDGLSSLPFHLTLDENDGIWIGTPHGLDYFNGKTFSHIGSDRGIPDEMISAISYLKSEKTLFVGSESGIKSVRNGVVKNIDAPELDNTMVLSISPYRDSLMLFGSTGAGVMIYNPKSKERRVLTRKEGLTSDFVYFVAQDDEDRIWIGMEKGISTIRLNNKLEIIENLHYDYENGLAGMETNQNAFYLGKDYKYFGLVDGLYQFNNFDNNKEKSFDLHLTDIQILYGEYPLSEYSDGQEGFFKIPTHPVLPHDKNHLTFYFNRVDKRYPKSVKFKYYMENFDKTWSQPSSLNQVTYSNLPAGEYVFRVMATNNEGSWSEKAIVYPFIIKAPFYQTASFLAGVIIFVAGSITLLMYLRVRQKVQKTIETERIRIQEIENLRKEIARDFHDEMGNQLTRIINYVSLMKLNGNGTHLVPEKDQKHQADLYKKVEESAKYLYSGTRDFIWAIDPVNDELTKLFIHIRDFGEKLFEEKSIQFRAYDQVKEYVKLPNGFSREANLIFKEAMTNAFKYSDAKNVSFSLQRVNGHLELSFEDDGKGFDFSETDKFNGLRNIKARAERIGAYLNIKTKSCEGTAITLEFKLTKNIDHGHAI